MTLWLRELDYRLLKHNVHFLESYLMRKFYLVILLLFFKISLASANTPLQEKLEDTIKNYLSSRFLNATYMFCDNDGTIVMGAHGIRSLKTHELLKENESF